ncbi:transcription factor bHLH113-like protein [Tanacetum coccineum]
MPQNKAATIDPISGGTFSRLLFSGTDVVDDALNNTTFTFSSNDQKPLKMLCFGQKNPTTATYNVNDNDKSLSTSSTTTSLSSSSNVKRNKGCDYYQPVVLSTSVTTTTTTTTTGATVTPSGSNRRSNKKMKPENTPPASHAKVKKEKLGERIAALQQIVSPYGKTDTASVLHEALGYIKFLQEQVQVLCSPYMKLIPATHIEGQEVGGGQRKKDLQSRGLCLVPVECTLHVAESNGADMWSPAMVNHHGSSALPRN